MTRNHTQFLLPLVQIDKPLCQAIQLPSGQTNSAKSPLTHHRTPFKIWQINNLANLTKPYNQGIKVQVTIKDIKNEDKLCMKSQPPEE